MHELTMNGWRRYGRQKSVKTLAVPGLLFVVDPEEIRLVLEGR